MLSSSRAPDLDCPPAPPWPFHVKGFRTNRACVLAHGPFGTWLPCCYPAVGHLFRFTHAFIFGAEPRISSAHNRWAPVLMLGPGDTRMTGTVRHLSQPVRCVPLNCVCVIMCHCGAGSVVLHALLWSPVSLRGSVSSAQCPNNEWDACGALADSRSCALSHSVHSPSRFP